MGDGSAVMAPWCGGCHRRHLPGLPCWQGRYRTNLVRRTLAAKGRVCWLCGRTGATSVDHVVPRSLGGTDADDNLIPSHLPCNAARGNRAPFTADPEPVPAGVGLSDRWRS